MGRDVLGPVRNYQDRRVALRCLETSFSQGCKWKALISKYIGAIPLSGDTPCTAEQSIAGGCAPKIFVNSAMIAKVGAEGWRRSVIFAAKLRPHPTCVETTLPRIRQVGESASPRRDVGKMIGGGKIKSQAGFWQVGFAVLSSYFSRRLRVLAQLAAVSPFTALSMLESAAPSGARNAIQHGGTFSEIDMGHWYTFRSYDAWAYDTPRSLIAAQLQA